MDDVDALAAVLKPCELPDPWTDGLYSVILTGTAEDVSADRLAALRAAGWELIPTAWLSSKAPAALAETPTKVATSATSVKREALRVAAQRLSDKRTADNDGFWVSAREMRYLAEALAALAETPEAAT